MNKYLNNFEMNRENEDIPLSVLFSDSSSLEQSTYHSKEEKLNAFINLCKNTSGKDLSQTNIIQSVVQNALLIEFGEKILKDRDMVNTISQSINTELILKEEVLNFAFKHFQQIRIDSALIN
ncbi:MAG: hypothetical protein A2Y40_08475 [Candidatus Margulisbacteria bacterium GWF2_35_9]|nr:MAG: hypothetical protein A2Y40_08475 [Candidatus Margulisbacteria bacterium GWF2_35_9]